MIARFEVDKLAKLPENKYILNIDLTEAELKGIIAGDKYPQSKVFTYQAGHDGRLVKDSEMYISINVGQLI